LCTSGQELSYPWLVELTLALLLMKAVVLELTLSVELDLVDCSMTTTMFAVVVEVEVAEVVGVVVYRNQQTTMVHY